jgi:Fe-Mn family superoxide dismutase
LEAISKNFTDFNNFKEAFKSKIEHRFIPGWVWLCMAPDGNLIITQTNNMDNNLMMGVAEIQCIPIMGIDLWEHAYWVDHDGCASTSYLETFWTNVDWD